MRITILILIALALAAGIPASAQIDRVCSDLITPSRILAWCTAKREDGGTSNSHPPPQTQHAPAGQFGRRVFMHVRNYSISGCLRDVPNRVTV
jgi:hypothetical protein